jgi:hypothetical protein
MVPLRACPKRNYPSRGSCLQRGTTSIIPIFRFVNVPEWILLSILQAQARGGGNYATLLGRISLRPEPYAGSR